MNLYDLIITSPKELKVTWKRKFGIGSALYISIRYNTILALLFRAVQSSGVARTVPVCIIIFLRSLANKWFSGTSDGYSTLKYTEYSNQVQTTTNRQYSHAHLFTILLCR